MAFDSIYFYIDCDIFTSSPLPFVSPNNPQIRTTAEFDWNHITQSLRRASECLSSLLKTGSNVLSIAILEILSRKDKSVFSSRLWRCSRRMWASRLPEFQPAPFISENVSERRRPTGGWREARIVHFNKRELIVWRQTLFASLILN